jgi:hypothetical protein
MSASGTPLKIRLDQIIEGLEELLNEEWPSDKWVEKQKETRSRFDDFRREVKQLLGSSPVLFPASTASDLLIN